MLYQNRLFLVLGLVTAGILTCPAVAAPTVKRLTGVSTSDIQNVNATQSKSSLTNQRASSIRSFGSTTKSVTGATNTANVVNTVPKTTESANSMRISGLHGNIVKGINSVISSDHKTSTSGGATSNLTERVTNLEEKIATKQEILESGDGINIDGKTVSVSEEIAVLPEKVAEIDQEIHDINDRIDGINLGNYYTINGTEEYLQRNYYTKQYVDQIVSQLSNAKIADSFDPSFLNKD